MSYRILQPYLMTISSGHATVGGAVHVKLNLPSVPEDTHVSSVVMSVEQSYNLRSPTKPGVTANPLPHKRRVFRLDSRTPLRPSGPVTPPAKEAHSSPLTKGKPTTVVHTKHAAPSGANLLAFVAKGESLEVSHVARLPDDDMRWCRSLVTCMES